MADVIGILLSTCAVLYSIYFAVILDSTTPWFERAGPTGQADTGAVQGKRPMPAQQTMPSRKST